MAVQQLSIADTSPRIRHQTGRLSPVVGSDNRALGADAEVFEGRFSDELDFERNDRVPHDRGGAQTSRAATHNKFEYSTSARRVNAPSKSPATVEQCASAMSQARSAFSTPCTLDSDELEDLPDSPDEITASAVSSIERLVGSLSNCLPTVIGFSRQYKPKNSDVTTSKIAALLDISVTLLQATSTALSVAFDSNIVIVQRHGGVKEEVEVSAIQRQFEEQAAILRK